MSELAESSLEPTSLRQWMLRALLAVVAVALLAFVALWLKTLTEVPAAPKRQVAKISILPDTPPPPPPPPKQEQKPEPAKDEPKQAMREEQLKPEVPKPANEPIKMEGPAGDGPSAFAAGAVSREYQGGAPVVGAAGGSGNAPDRAQERFYANSVRQLLRDEIEKNLRADAGEMVANFAVWVEADGSIRRFDLSPTGDATHDADLRAAFEQTSRRLRLPGHTGLPQPMRFKLSVRPA